MSVVHVQPIPGKTEWNDTLAGAYVVTLAIASTEGHFKERVVREFDSDGFVVIEWGEISEFNLETNDWHSEETQQLHEYLSSEHPVQYSCFDTYPHGGLDA